MGTDYVLLAEKEEMWAQMLMQTLQNHQIPCTSLPVYGAGFALKTGMQDKLQVYVPAAHKMAAQEILYALFEEG